MTMRIVIVDDSASALLALCNAAKAPGRLISSFLDPREALSFIKTNVIDLLIVDYTMPHFSGIRLIKAGRRSVNRDVPIVMVTSENDPAVMVEAIDAGATEFLHKPFNAAELQARVRNLLQLRKAQLALADKARQLEDDVVGAVETMKRREEEVIWRLSRAMAYRDGDTGEHIDRVARIARLIGEGLGLAEDRCRMIYLATPLHDVGKIGVSDAILRKPGRLSQQETVEMRKHVAIGVGILEGSGSALITVAEKIVAGHHEKWDGTGYPRGLAGEEIPLEARIVAVADVFDALCSVRPYKPAWPISEAYDEITRSSGSHFDPQCVAAFHARWAGIAKVMSDQCSEQRVVEQ
jgi:putative two-component system response regulator